MNLAFLSCACLLHCRAVETGPSAGLAAPDTLVVEQQTVSDSLLQLIAGASVRRAVTTGFDSDSKTLVSQKKSLSKSSREQFKFLLSDKANFKSDDTVFGQFMPSVSVTMKSKLTQLFADPQKAPRLVVIDYLQLMIRRMRMWEKLTLTPGSFCIPDGSTSSTRRWSRTVIGRPSMISTESIQVRRTVGVPSGT